MRPPLRPPCLALLLATPLPAVAGSLELESVAQLRHDHFGELYVPATQLLIFQQDDGPVALDGYLGLEWMAGLPTPGDTDIYRLSASGDLAGGTWAAGRQRGRGALRAQTFDGLAYRHGLGERAWAEAWAGLARHQDIDDLLDYASMARAALGWSGDALMVRGGAELAQGPETDMVARQDLEALLRLGSGPRPGRFGARAVVAELPAAGSAALEWARADLAVRPWSPLEIGLHAQHRATIDPGSLFGDAILDALAGGVVQEAGASLRLIGARWSTLSVRSALVGYGEGHSWGNKLDVAWQPGRSDATWRISPTYSSRTGPGGQYHAVSSVLRWRASDATSVTGTAAIVPFQRKDEPWGTILTGGLQLQQRVAGWARLGAMVDVASEGGAMLDVRGGATLNLGWSS